MIEVEAFLSALPDSVPLVADGDSDMHMHVLERELELPIEARLRATAALWVSAPRGRYQTGFAEQHGRIRARFVRSE